MKKIITIIILVVMLAMLAGCGATEDVNTTEVPETTDFYAYDSDVKDFWQLVYAEQKIYIWVWTPDNTVWVANGNSSFTKWTKNGQDVIWQGSIEKTFAAAN